MSALFHLAVHVTDLNEARRFYGELLGCQEGRSTDTWVDFDFFGHQLSLHLGTPFTTTNTGLVAGKNVPMPHFGAVLPMAQWQQLAQRLQQAGVEFDYAPDIRFQGEPGEQATLFLRDPSGNPLEFKGFQAESGVFAQ